MQVRMKQQIRRQPVRRGPRVLRRASTVRGVSAPSMRSLRSGYAFSHQRGFGELITTGSMMSVRPRPRSARIKGPPPRYGRQQGRQPRYGRQQDAAVTSTDVDEVDDDRRPTTHTVCCLHLCFLSALCYISAALAMALCLSVCLSVTWRYHAETTEGIELLLSAPDSREEYCNEHVCLCSSLSVREHISGTTGPIVTKFSVYYPWPWLGPRTVALRYVKYFRFYE